MQRLRTRLRAGATAFPPATFALNFLTGALDSGVTFTRGSNATLVDSTGKITYAPANLLLQSQTFDNASWPKVRTTITANSTVAPDGTSTADKLVEDTTASSTHFTSQSANYTAGTTYTLSVSVKAAERSWFDIQLPAALMGTIRNAFFDVSNGTVGTVTSGVTAAIVSTGNGWYRCSVTFTPTASVGTSSAFLLANADNSISYTGDGTSGLFLWGAQLEPVTYQTTPGTYNATTAAAYYGPRFDYDPVTLAAKGLLIEEQRTNLVTYSEQFDNAAWVKSQVTVTANATLAPNGLLVADKIIENTAATTYHAIYPGSSPTGSVTGAYTFTVYAKAAERRYISLDMNSYLDGVVFDLQNGTVTGTSTFYTSSITPAGNGWYRCSVSKNYTVATTLYAEAIISTSATAPNAYTGDGTSGIYLYGAQLEAGAFATSYIPTVASTVTRSADVATMTGTNFSSWYNQTEGTFVADVSSTAPSARSLTASAGAVTDQLFLQGGAATSIAFNVFTASAFVAQLGSLPASLIKKVAGAYKVNDFAASVDGGAVATDTSGALATYSQLNLGANALGSGGFLNGHIRSIAYYNTRLPNAQLQTLTAPQMNTTLRLDFINGIYEG